MNEVAIFDFETSPVRSVMIDGEPWFVGKDVCRCLEIAKHHQALERLRNDERGTCIIGTTSGNRPMKIINEPGVYRLVFSSRTEAAERFKHWLAHEVLPAIRKTGRYEARPANRAPGDADNMLKELNIVREYRLLFGRTAARNVLKWFPNLPQASEVIPAISHNDSDRIESFLAAETVKDETARISASELYAAYIEHCNDTNFTTPATIAKFGRTLNELGYKKHKTGGTIFRHGLRLREPE